MKNKKVMDGFPSSRDKQVNWKNYQSTNDHLSWTHSNMGAILPVIQVPRAGDVFYWNEKHNENLLDGIQITSFNKTLSADECFKDANVDSILITKGNDILFEQYFNFASKTKHHVWYSMTKSLVAVTFGKIKEKHNIEIDDLVSKYIKEIKEGQSGFGRTKIINVLNHASGLSVKEEYSDKESLMVKYFLPVGLMVPSLGIEYWPDLQTTKILGSYDFIAKFIEEDPKLIPGEKFEYASSNADALGWIMTRLENKGLEEIISEVIWQKLGAENDGVFWSDRCLLPLATGGFNTTARDAAKFGKLVLDYGKNWKGEQIISKEWIEQITKEDEENKKAWDANLYEKKRNTLFTGYQNMWWLINPQDGEFAAIGIHGQMLYINRKRNVVISLFSSAKSSSNLEYQKTKRSFDLITKIGRSL